MAFTPLLAAYLPIEQIGAESLRERGASSALPPLYFLHVWWARRPLIVSRAAVLASLLPAYEAVAQADDPALQAAFPTREAYHAWFLRLLGIYGDPAATRRLLQEAKRTGKRLGANPYGYPRAFTSNPDPESLDLMRRLLRLVWGREDLTVLDPFAGGGSIPFEAIRYGFEALANELNPVAAVVLQATLDYPARFGPALAAEIRRWGQVWADRVRERLAPYFPKAEGENIFAYLWARTVACPRTGKPVPLSPNWWLSKGKTPLAVRPLVHETWDAPRFVILRRAGNGWAPVDPASVPPPFDPETVGAGFDPDEGTVRRGVGRSLWTGEAIPGDYIKQEAQAGRMGQTLYAVALKKRGGFAFRAPTEADLDAVARAEAEARRQRPRWEAEDLIPTEAVPAGLKTAEPMRYGMRAWADFFAPRQLLALATFVEELRALRPQLQAALGPEKAAAVETYLAFAVDKAADRNSYQTRWIPQRHVIANTFDRHDFANPMCKFFRDEKGGSPP